jgi:molecular chaperone GrpE (heat shock protein)
VIEDTPNPDALAEIAPPAEKAPVSEQLALIQLQLNNLNDTVIGLKNCFEERLQYDTAKNRAFDTLYAKLAEQNTDQGAALKKNLVLSLLLLYDRMHLAEAGLPADSEGRQRIVELRTELLDILYAEDVTPMNVVSSEFDRARQLAVSSVQTPDPAQDSTVDAVVREGFLMGSRVLRPQSVVVRRYTKSIEQELSKGA